MWRASRYSNTFPSTAREMALRHTASLMSSGLSRGNCATKSNVWLCSDSTSDLLIPQEMASPPLARQSAGKYGCPLRTIHGVSRMARIGMLLSDNVCQIPMYVDGITSPGLMFHGRVDVVNTKSG